MKEMTAIIVLAIIFVGLGFALGRFTAPGSDENYREVIAALRKENSIKEKILQKYMLMYEDLIMTIRQLMSGKYYPPPKSLAPSTNG